MRALKIVGIVLASLLVLALAGIAILISQFDATRLKAEATQIVQQKYQRTLKIDGNFKPCLSG